MVENDKVISGMLSDELTRCNEMLSSLEKTLLNFPKGSLNTRKKHYKNKVYSYFYLKYRGEGGKVISKHISDKDIDGIKEKLRLREKYYKEIQSYKKKIAYLSKVINAAKNKKH